MSGVSEEQVQSIVDMVISKHNLNDYVYFTDQKFNSIAHNYFGVLIPVTLKSKDKTNSGTNNITVIELVLKLSPSDERFRVSGALTKFFACEIYVYSTLLVKYQQFQEKVRPESQFIMPKCYYLCKDYCKEVIAMENLCAKGFAPFTKSFFLDYDHIQVALKALAKFHALSFILNKQDPKLFDEVAIICIPLTSESNSRFTGILLDRLEKAIDKFQGTNYLPILNHLKVKCCKYIKSAAYSVQKKCICHGDLWADNIMFSYDKDHRPRDACIIDYQTVQMGSAAFDALYLIISSASSCLRKENYFNLLNIYYETFTAFLSEVGLESQNIYSRQMFDEDLKLVAPACFIKANTALWLKSGLQEEGHVRSKIVFASPQEREDAVHSYKSIITDIIQDYISYGYFSQLDTY